MQMKRPLTLFTPPPDDQRGLSDRLFFLLSISVYRPQGRGFVDMDLLRDVIKKTIQVQKHPRFFSGQRAVDTGVSSTGDSCG